MSGARPDLRSGITIVAVVIVSLLAVWLVLPKVEPAGPPEIEAECGPLRACPEERMSCYLGDCYPIPDGNEKKVLAKCEIGAACPNTECACRAPLKCNLEAGRCEAPDDICLLSDVQQAVDRLYAQCAGRKTGADVETCPPGELKDYVMNDPAFDDLIRSFPGVFTVHFDYAQPPEDRGSQQTRWLGQFEPYYATQFEGHRPALDEAKVTFIVGRASWGKRASTREKTINQRYALRRASVTQAMIKKIYDKAGLDGDKFVAASAIFSVIDPGRAHEIGTFLERYSANRIITWDKQAFERIQRATQEQHEASAEDYQWAQNTLNQVVVVVPIPCKPSGSEDKK